MRVYPLVKALNKYTFLHIPSFTALIHCVVCLIILLQAYYGRKHTITVVRCKIIKWEKICASLWLLQQTAREKREETPSEYSVQQNL